MPSTLQSSLDPSRLIRVAQRPTPAGHRLSCRSSGRFGQIPGFPCNQDQRFEQRPASIQRKSKRTTSKLLAKSLFRFAEPLEQPHKLTVEEAKRARKEIVSGVMNNMSPELRNSALDVLTTLSHSPIHQRHMTHFIQYNLDIKTSYARLCLRIYPLSALLDLIEIPRSIESLNQSLTRDPILVPCQQHSMKLSPVELHRIRRSLWHFQLCYDIYHPESQDLLRKPTTSNQEAR